jgi:hypothetical protein
MRDETRVIVDLNREQGIKTEVHVEDGKTVFVKTYDAEPFLRHAAELRAQTRGESWGEYGRKVGVIPMADLAKMMRQGGELDGKEMRKWLRTWLQQNPAFVTFEKYLKT